MSLEARDLSLSISGIPLLRGINLRVLPGEVTTIVGPNGAGKTSLLRCLVNELAVTAGQVLFNNREIKDWSASDRARSLSVLPQQSLLDFPFTVDEVVMLGRTPHDTGIQRDREIVAAALTAVDGAYLVGRFYTQLSGGEKQRVHLARVLAQIWEPSTVVQHPEKNVTEQKFTERYLVLDEPTSSFDLAHQQLTLNIVQTFASKGVGVLMVMHDLNLAAHCSDQIVLMQCGEIVTSGTPEEVLTPNNIRTVFDVEVEISVHPQTGKPLVIT
ncbi:MAG: heme ABC transporter ATP-binding protein [Porticoccaceae bacterium]|nr:MAG: heme ABC transporter ATP-binding protein [Porticoccaceae bacterium]